jgi:alpha-ketoglutarate-dependent taurine dioxygenase
MRGLEEMERGFDKFRNVSRKAVSLSPETLVKKSQLGNEEVSTLVLQPVLENVNPSKWMAHNQSFIAAELLKHGSILFRDFEVDSVARFEECARALTPELLDYRERSSPRSEVSRGIYTSTDHPSDQYIHFHNEQSYTHSWPMKLWFFCLKAAQQGGATPIADGRKVLQRLDAKIKERFMQKKVMYVRNYGDGMGLSWQDAFQTSSKQAVEDYCRKVSIDFEWKADERLRTRQVFETITSHPKTGEMLWFEHTAFFHVSSLEPSVRQALLAEFEEQDLPFNTYYGDGSPIEDSALAAIREAYRQTALRFSWQEGDILLIDNMLTSHSREPYVGPRKIVVAMAELYDKKSDGQAAFS